MSAASPVVLDGFDVLDDARVQLPVEVVTRMWLTGLRLEEIPGQEEPRVTVRTVVETERVTLGGGAILPVKLSIRLISRSENSSQWSPITKGVAFLSYFGQW